ncbi:MAG: RibD family protein [Pseudomonadota bacterium]
MSQIAALAPPRIVADMPVPGQNGVDIPVFEELRAARKKGARMAVAQLGQSLDGRIATPTGHSHFVNGPEALTFLHRLRAAVDAVVVGAGTALADDPQLTVRRCEGSHPARVLIDLRRRAGGRLKMLCDDGVRRLVFGAAHDDDPAGVEVIEAEAPLGPHDILSALEAKGLRTVLVEGGARTVADFVSAGALDRICIAVAPLIIGSGPIGLCLPPIERLDSAIRPRTAVSMMEDGDVLFDCALR